MTQHVPTTFHDLVLPEQLKLVRSGTAYFAQRLVALSAADLAAPSALPDWTRKHVVAHVGYNADGLSRVLDWARTGVETPMYPSIEARATQISEGVATLDNVALRSLFNRSAADLDEHWRALTPTTWAAEIRNMKGATLPASAAVWMRAKEVWIHAVDLGTGATFDDFPAPILESILTDVVDSWRANDAASDVTIAVDGRETLAVQPNSTPMHTARGSLAAVAQWAAGRGADLLASDAPTPPAWY